MTSEMLSVLCDLIADHVDDGNKYEYEQVFGSVELADDKLTVTAVDTDKEFVITVTAKEQ